MALDSRAPVRHNSKPSFSLVVPLFNEEARFAEHAIELTDFIGRYPPGSELVFVDDGSVDRTVEVVAEFLTTHANVSARLIRRRHEGKGAAVRAGLAEAPSE